MGADIPIKVASSTDLSCISKEQQERLEHVRSLCREMVSADEVDDIRVTIPGSYHHMCKNHAVVSLPRLATDTHAVYRKINIYNTYWSNPNSPSPEKWRHERVVDVIPLFTMENSEYEILYSTNLSKDDVTQILLIIIKGVVEYPAKSDLKPRPPIEAAKIKSIQLDRTIAPKGLIRIHEVKQPEISSRIDVYEGYLENEALIIVRSFGMHIN